MAKVGMHNPKIRPATLDDAEAIAKVHVQSWQETYRGHIADELLDRLSVESRTIMWTDAMNTVEADKHLFVAEMASEADTSTGSGTYSEIVAFISGGKLRADELEETTNSTTELYAIYCLSKFQGLNIGKRLVKVLVDEFVAAGHDEMLVWVLTSNPSKHFYMHLGASYHSELIIF